MNPERDLPAFDKNEYERANQSWICGRAGDGTPCARGPNDRGECGAVCLPVKIDEHYVCQNAATYAGKCDDGPLADGACSHFPARCDPLKKGRSFICGLSICPDGPLPDGSCCRPVPPCRPVRRVLARRRLFTMMTFALALGFILVMAGGPGRQQMISPGELTSHHGTAAGQCAACHTSGNGTLLDWIHAAADGHDRSADQQKCLKCHPRMRDFAGDPHTFDPGKLAAFTRKQREQPATSASVALQLARGGFRPEADIACDQCHQEHRGPDHDLRAMSNARCQVCHAETFASFTVGHPEFENYPNTRRDGIVFDHVSHYGRHFQDTGRLPETEAARVFFDDTLARQQTCVRCHTVDDAGRTMLIGRYEETCSACHEDQITSDLTTGMTVLSLPVFDRQRQNAAAEWPLDAASHPRAGGSLSPILRLLLSANPEYAESDRVIAALDLAHLGSADGEQLAAAAELEGLLMEEFADIARFGHGGITARLTAVLGDGASPDEITRLAQWLPDDALDAMHDWLRSAEPTARQPRALGLVLDRRELSLRYRPIRHADARLKTWIDVAVRLGHDADPASPIHQLYRSLTSDSATGRCMKCHTLTTSPDGTPAVNWTSIPSQSRAAFTSFAHRPHIVLLQDEACQQCHELSQASQRSYDADGAARAVLQADGATALTSEIAQFDFHPMQKSDCATCHRRGQSSENCTTCHAYHDSRTLSVHVGP